MELPTHSHPFDNAYVHPMHMAAFSINITCFGYGRFWSGVGLGLDH